MNKKTFLGFFSGTVITGILGFALTPLLAWYFKPEAITTYAIFQLLLSLSFLFFGVGLEQSYVRKFYEEENKAKLILNTCYIPVIFFIFVIFLSFYFETQILNKYITIEIKYLDLYFLVAAMFNFFYLRSSLNLRMNHKGVLFSFFSILPRALVLIAVCLFPFIGYLNGGVYLFYIQIIAISITSIFIVFLTKKSWFTSFQSKISFRYTVELLRYSTPLFFSGILLLGLNGIDRFMLVEMTTPLESAKFILAMSLASVGTLLSSFFLTIWSPLLLKSDAEDESNSKKLVENIAPLVTMIVVLFLSCVALFSWLVDYFLPSQYAEVKKLLIPCMFYPLINMLSNVTSSGLTIKRKTLSILIATAVALIVNVILNYTLIPNLKANGAAIASAISIFVMLVIKTELSCVYWFKIKRFEIYINILVILILGIATVVIELNTISYYIIWALYLFIYLIFNMKTFKSNFLLLNTYMRS